MLPAPPPPDLPPREQALRIAAVRQEMSARNVAFLVLTDQKNVEYFSGYRTLSWGYHSRPMFLVIDHHDVTAVANRIESRNLEARPRDFSIFYYDGYLAEGAQAIVQRLALSDPAASAVAAIRSRDSATHGFAWPLPRALSSALARRGPTPDFNVGFVIIEHPRIACSLTLEGCI